jgi:hypothetical protein
MRGKPECCYWQLRDESSHHPQVAALYKRQRIWLEQTQGWQWGEVLLFSDVQTGAASVSA